MIESFQEMKLQAGNKTEVDVDQIARKLTVFCVSSNDYQGLTMNQAEGARVSFCCSDIDSAEAWHVEAKTKLATIKQNRF